MSIEASNWAWKQQGVTPAEKLILLCLSDHADDLGENCWPSQQRISVKTGVGRESVSRAIRRFGTVKALDPAGNEVVGIIETIKQRLPGMGAIAFNKYKLLLDRVILSHTGVRKSHKPIVTESHSRVITDHTPCDNLAPGACDDRSHNPSEDNRQREPSSKSGTISESPQDQKPEESESANRGPNDPVLLVGAELWAKAESYFAEIGKPVGIVQREMLFYELVKLQAAGNDPVEVVRRTIAYQWRSFRPIIGTIGDSPPGPDEDLTLDEIRDRAAKRQ